MLSNENKNNENLPKEVEIFTVKQVAKILKTSPNSVYKLIKNGFLKSIIIGSTKVTYKSLMEFIEKYDGQDLSHAC